MKRKLRVVQEQDVQQHEEFLMRGHIISLMTNLVMFVIMFLFISQANY